MMAYTAPASRRWRRLRLHFGEVRIVAPDVERSSAGHSITATRPLTYKRTPLNGPGGVPRQRDARRLRGAGDLSLG